MAHRHWPTRNAPGVLAQLQSAASQGLFVARLFNGEQARSPLRGRACRRGCSRYSSMNHLHTINAAAERVRTAIRSCGEPSTHPVAPNIAEVGKAKGLQRE